MIHKRIVILEGDDIWIETTLKNSLPEGKTSKIFGPGRSIIIETIEGEIFSKEKIPKYKPESRFEK